MNILKQFGEIFEDIQTDVVVLEVNLGEYLQGLPDVTFQEIVR